MAKGVALAWDLIARDGASPTFNRVAASADRAAASTAKAESGVLGFGKKAVAALGALATIDFAVHAVKDAAEFQSAMNRIHTVVGATTAEVQSMSKALLTLAPSVATGPQELAVSLYHMEAIGLRGAAALDAVKVAAEGAKIGNADLEDTTNALTATIQSGIAGNQSFAKTMSQLLTIVGTGDMKLQDFNEALGSGLLAVMANAGVSLRDVGAALAVFGDNNIRGADAATMLRVAVQAMQAPAKAGADALASIGLSTHTLKDDLLKGGLNAAITDLHKHLDAAGQSGKRAGSLLVTAFGKKANTGIGVLIKTFGLLQTKYGIIDKNTDNFAEKWQSTTKTAAFAFDKLRAEFEVVAITIGTKLIPVATGLIDFLTGDLGPALVGPWRALETVLSVVGTGLAAVAHVIGDLHLPLGGIAVAALGAFAAFKLFSAVPALIDAIHFRLLLAQEAIQGFGASAAVAGGEVAAGGAVASVGWRGLLGPLAAAGIGIALLVSAFHRSSGASKEAAAAAKAYTEALAAGGDKTTLVDAITKQLADNDVPQKIAELNKALGTTSFAGQQFVTALQGGGKPLDQLRARLEAVAAAGNHMSATVSGKGGAAISGTISPAAKAASKLLSDLNAQFYGLSKAAKKDLTDTKAFAGVSSSIDKVSEVTKVGSDTAKKYAEMLGIVVDKNGIAAVSSKTLENAVGKVTHAYDSATAAGDDFLKAMSSFSGTAGTAADRAALIGATLKASNGDLLSYASNMNASATANRTFTKDVRDAAKTAKMTTKDYLASVVNLKTGTINYNKAAAGPLIQNLQAIQTAGMNAAQATFQHARATMGGKRAADAAYKVYRSSTRGQLIDEFTKLTGNAGAAKRLADKYLGMPKKIKTLIEQEGANPIVTVLNKLGTQLAYLTGHPWNVDVTTSYHTKGSLSSLPSVPGYKPPKHATGTGSSGLADGWGTVGEQGGNPNSWELIHKQGSRVDIYSNKQSRAMTGMDHAPGYASGTGARTPAHRAGGPQRIAGELTISEDTQGRLRAWVEGIVLDHADLNATVGRMR